MPDLPRSARLSLHDAIGYVADQCECDLIKAGKAVFYALGEGALIAHANVLNKYRTPGSTGYLDDGVQPAPAVLWAGYPWPWFELRAVRPRGMAKYREHTSEGKDIGPVFDNPTLAIADIDRWLGSAGEPPRRAEPALGATVKEALAEDSEAPSGRRTRLTYLPWLASFLDKLPPETTISTDDIAGLFIAHVDALKTAGEPAPARLAQRRNIDVQVSKLWPKIRARKVRPPAG